MSEEIANATDTSLSRIGTFPSTGIFRAGDIVTHVLNPKALKGGLVV
jgi:hypothetical protein